MTWTLYDYKSKRGHNEIKEWALKLQTKQQSTLNEKLLQVQLHGNSLNDSLLSDSSAQDKQVKKLRFSQGGVQLRPLLCEGPTRNDQNQYNKEYTLLCGATEKGDKIKPKNAYETATQRRQEVIDDHKSRRCRHERVTPKSSDSNKRDRKKKTKKRSNRRFYR